MHDASEMPEAPEPGAAAELSEKISTANERGEGKQVAVSVTISVLSIVSALLLIVSQRTHTEASLLEQRAADIELFRLERVLFQRQLTSEADILTAVSALQDHGKQNPAGVSRDDKIAPLIARSTSLGAKVRADVDDTTKNAEQVEATEGAVQRRLNRLTLSQAVFQIAVLLTSLTLYTRRRLYFILGYVFGGVAALIAVFAFFA